MFTHNSDSKYHKTTHHITGGKVRRKKLVLFIAIVMAMFTALFANTITIGSGTATNGNIPINTNWGYTYSQQIYTQAQINTAGDIQKIKFYKNAGTITNSTAWVVYMGHTTKTAFSSTTDWIPVAQLTPVFNGNVTFPTTEGWYEITLSTPFAYNNTDNLVIAVDENTAGYGNAVSHRVFTAATNSVIYYRSDSTNPNPSSPPSASSRVATPNQIQLVFPSTAPPNPATTPSPADLATTVSITPTLSWVSGGGGETSYDIHFGTNATPPYVTNQVPNTYSPSSLSYNTTYYWQIVPRNVHGPAVNCPIWSFTTGPDPTITELPVTETFDGTTYPPYGWTHILGSGATGWQRSTGSSSPTVTPYSGAGMLYYNSDGMSSGANATLISPPIDASRSEHMYKVSFWMYRGNAYLTSADRVEVFVNSSASATGATLVGTVNRSINLAPVVAAVGWYEYTFEIGQGGGRDIKYVLLKATSGYGNNMNVDEVTFFSSELAGPPNPAILTSPANAGTNIAISTNLVWASGGGAPTGYKVYLGTTVENMEMVSDQAGTEYDPPANLLFNQIYYWQIDPYNDNGRASNDFTLPTWSFTTATGIAGTPSPANNATNQDATNRTLGWTAVAGASGYKVKAGTTTGASDLVNMASVATNSYVHTANWPYLTDVFWTVYTVNGSQEVQGPEWKFTTGANPTLTPPFVQDFTDTTFPPANWQNRTGFLTANSVLAAGSSWNRGLFGNTGSNNGARINVWSTTVRGWLITAPIDLDAKASYNLEFDLALTPYTGSAATTLGEDDTLAVVISTDNGTTWSSSNILKQWTAADGISNTGQHEVIDLSEYSGVVRIGFYGSSTLANADNYWYVDNVAVASADAPPSAPATPTPANNATNVAITTNLSWNASSGAPTGYYVFMSTNGTDFERVSDQAGTTYDPADNFSFATQYWWYVTAYNNGGETQSATWTFTTTNGKATTPNPANNTTNYVASLRTLGWAAVSGATGYKIKIGTTTGGSEIVDMAVLATNSYTHPTNWQYGTQYFWTVYTMNGAQMIAGDEWSFTIGADPTITLPYYNTFSGTTPLNGWIVQMSAGVNNLWSLSSTANAGGSSPELKCTYQNIDPGMTRVVSAPVNASGTTALVAKFRHMYDWYDDGVDLKFQMSPDMETWTDLWTNTPVGGNVLATEVSVDINSGLDQTVYFGWYISGNLYNTDGWFIDNVKLLFPNTEVTQTTAAGGSATVIPPAVTNTTTNEPITPQVQITGLANPTATVAVYVGYASANVTLPNAGLNLTLSGTSFANTTVTVTHNLGFIPAQLAYRVLPSNNWILVNAPVAEPFWTTTTASFVVAGSKAPGDVEVVFPQNEDQTLPVALSSFTAVLTADLFVRIAWISETETNHLGYNLFRNDSRSLDTATRINPALIDEGSAVGTQMSYAFTDKEVDNNHLYYYWLESVAVDGTLEYAGPIMVVIGDPNAEPPTPVIPVATALLSAFPNPFNPQTNLRYSLKDAGNVKIEVYNARGQLIRSFTRNHEVPGFYSVVWDGKDSKGNHVSSGVYFYRMSSGKYSATRKMMLMK